MSISSYYYLLLAFYSISVDVGAAAAPLKPKPIEPRELVNDLGAVMLLINFSI